MNIINKFKLAYKEKEWTKVIKLFEEAKSLTPKNDFKKFIDQNKGRTLKEMQEKYEIPISVSTLRRGIKKLNYTRKKKHIILKKEMKKQEKNL